jgi:hypothetical protein
MKMEACNFEAAKVRVAEILRLDTKKPTRAKYQKSDAASLLNCPPESRDDALAVAYLAYRLNVPLDRVPIPSTRMVGLKALGYFDPPPSGSKAKPKLIGNYSCTIFETVGADGKIHAHRIYLAEEGREKRTSERDRTAGRARRRNRPRSSVRTTSPDGLSCGVIRAGRYTSSLPKVSKPLRL